MIIEKLRSIFLKFLDISRQPEKSQSIFVYAGKFERKLSALELYKNGYADHLILSIGRYEWRKFLEIKLEVNKKLLKLIQNTPPQKRHFFAELQGSYHHCYPIKIEKLGTYGESKSLSKLIKKRKLEKVMILSSGYHLRRIVLVVKKYLGSFNVNIIPVSTFCHENNNFGFYDSKRKEKIGEAVKEFIKYILYEIYVEIL